MSDLIRLSRACLGVEEKEAILRIMDEGYLGMGNEVKAFEQELEDFLAARWKVACVNTGTSALHLALQACGIGTGDEVIVPSLTYVASFQAISATGAIPVACDIDLKNGSMDPIDVAKKITSRTKALMPVLYGGDKGNLNEIYAVAKKNKLRVIEDAAHAFGASIDGERDIICFSFDGIKNITCGEGGAVVSRDPNILERVKDLRLLAVRKDTEKRYQGQRSWDFEVEEQGWRYHMSNLNAAIGRAQLKKIDTFAQKRLSLAHLYRQELQNLPMRFLDLDWAHIVPHIFVIIVSEEQRNELKTFLENNGVETGIHYKPNHLLKKFKGFECLNAEKFWTQALTLPLHCLLDEKDVLKVTDLIKLFFSKA